MSQALVLESLPVEELEAVFGVWQRERRRLATRFSGASMMPTIAPGQEVFLQCGVDPQVGNVIVCLVDGRLLVHRLSARSKDWLMTWGDANQLPDPPIDGACCLGAIDGAPAAPRSRRRAALMSMLVLPRTISLEDLARRVRFLYRLRHAWTRGPAYFVGKVTKTVLMR